MWLQFSTEEYFKIYAVWAFFVAACMQIIGTTSGTTCCMQTICMVPLPAPLVPIKLPHTLPKTAIYTPYPKLPP